MASDIGRCCRQVNVKFEIKPLPKLQLNIFSNPSPSSQQDELVHAQLLPVLPNGRASTGEVVMSCVGNALSHVLESTGLVVVLTPVGAVAIALGQRQCKGIGGG